MNKTALENFRQELETKKTELTNRVQMLEKDKTRGQGAISQDFAEQVVDVENDQVVDHLEALELKELENINNALIRIDNGSFGICTSCGNEISENRLKALPYAAVCTECTENQ